ncbi:uncharacterized protein METZ01_LOCUS447769 [marine metagenome]|uniref:Uncharacterized protein n=1 Tax=marine metagenome TaxID=408172 RepID=A0A382ZIL0_9ZZZZ
MSVTKGEGEWRGKSGQGRPWESEPSQNSGVSIDDGAAIEKPPNPIALGIEDR